MIDGLSDAAPGEARIKAAADVHKAILDKVPVSILFTPMWHVGLNSKLADYKPYGSDYYVIHEGFGLPSTGGAAGGTDGGADDAQTTSGAYSMVLNGLPVATLLLLGAIL
jgi:hypothetical protein